MQNGALARGGIRKGPRKMIGSGEPHCLSWRHRAPMRLEVAAPRPLSDRLAAMQFPSELLLRDALGRRLPPRGTLRSAMGPGGDVRTPQRIRPRHGPAVLRSARVRRPSLYVTRPRPP
ncbi:hypothetical protein NDU88_000080 [Pleurodeles waltl]|uniref:Uncharacterized protein n=1 Tax=Pleurodeles waltl TaxID=8319 RepID=A0AAV7S942_PLEWA|nr:hypothetical protein NDU88_000080 [Pleurodeles waltl]